MGGPSLLAQNEPLQPQTPKRAKCIKNRKKRVEKDDFAAEWLPRFIEIDIELEGARQAKPKGGWVMENEEGEEMVDADGDDEYHLRQLDAVAHGMDLLEAFDAAVAGVTLTRKTFVVKEMCANPFTAADSLRTFIIDFLKMWQTIKGEYYYHGMPRHGLFMKQFAKKLNAMLERGHKMAPDVINKVRSGGGGRPRKVQEEEDE